MGTVGHVEEGWLVAYSGSASVSVASIGAKVNEFNKPKENQPPLRAGNDWMDSTPGAPGGQALDPILGRL